MKTQSIVFGIYDPKAQDAQAKVMNGKCKSIKLLGKAPRRFYHSLLNDAEKSFTEQYPQYA